MDESIDILIEIIVPPEPDPLTKYRLEKDLNFMRNFPGINEDLLGT